MLKKFLQNCKNPKGIFGRIAVSVMNNGHSNISKWGISYLQLNEDAKVLDIGCGGGANVERLISMHPKGYIYGLDYSIDSVMVSRKKNTANLGKHCDIIHGSVSKLPFEEELFDGVTAFETVYFWPDIENDFAEVYRVLKPGGTFLICNELNDPNDTTWPDRVDGMHIYNSDQLETLLDGAGFAIEKILKHNSRQWLCVLAKKNN